MARRKLGAHNFVASRNFFTNLTHTRIVWQPWVEAFPEAPQVIREAADLVYMRLEVSGSGTSGSGTSGRELLGSL